MTHMKTQMDLLIKHLLAGAVEKVNAVEAADKHEDLDFYNEEKVKYLNNPEGFWTYGSENQGWNYYKDGYYDRARNRNQGNWHNKDNFKNNRSGVYVPNGNRDKAGNGSGCSRMEEMLAKVLKRVKSTDFGVKELKGDLSSMSQLVDLHFTFIKQLEH